MKKIEASISPFLLEPVKNALKELGISGVTVSEVQDFFPQENDSEGATFVPRLKIEVVVPDDRCSEVLAATCSSGRIPAHSAPVFAQDLADVVRIRTAEHGEAAI